MRTAPVSTIAVCTLMLAACAHNGEPASSATSELSWGAAEHVASADRFYFSGAPDAAGFAQARASGVEIVIDLRDPAESDWNPGDAAGAAGLAYHNVVVPRGEDQPYRPERIEQIEQILAAKPESKVLVYCGSGSRASGWYAIHLATANGMSPDEAIAAAATTGKLGASSEAAARAYLEDSRARE